MTPFMFAMTCVDISCQTPSITWPNASFTCHGIAGSAAGPHATTLPTSSSLSSILRSTLLREEAGGIGGGDYVDDSGDMGIVMIVVMRRDGDHVASSVLVILPCDTMRPIGQDVGKWTRAEKLADFVGLDVLQRYPEVVWLRTAKSERPQGDNREAHIVIRSDQVPILRGWGVLSMPEPKL